jgi:hypothetical protein
MPPKRRPAPSKKLPKDLSTVASPQYLKELSASPEGRADMCIRLMTDALPGNKVRLRPRLVLGRRDGPRRPCAARKENF